MYLSNAASYHLENTKRIILLSKHRIFNKSIFYPIITEYSFPPESYPNIVISILINGIHTCNRQRTIIPFTRRKITGTTIQCHISSYPYISLWIKQYRTNFLIFQLFIIDMTNLISFLIQYIQTFLVPINIRSQESVIHVIWLSVNKSGVVFPDRKVKVR